MAGLPGTARRIRRVIILDTNVLSSLMRHEPDEPVLAWFARTPAESVWTTSVTVFEIRSGIEILVEGKRRRELYEAFEAVLLEDLEHRVLSFDVPAADAAAAIAATQRRVGRPVEVRDIQIAGIAAARRAALATRNTRHFEGIGLSLVNPWSA